MNCPVLHYPKRIAVIKQVNEAIIVAILQGHLTLLHSLLPYLSCQRKMCSIIYHGTFVFLEGKFSYKSKALDLDKISDFCVMQIKPRKKKTTTPYAVHSTQFLLYNARHWDLEYKCILFVCVCVCVCVSKTTFIYVFF